MENKYNYSNTVHKWWCVCTHVIFLFFILILFFLYFINTVWSYTNSYSDNLYLSTEIGTGILQGTIGEYVYYNNRTLSKLNWNIDYLWYHTISLILHYNSFFVGIQLENGINTGKIGTIDDSDWADDNNPTVKTHYSKHDNYFERYQTYNANIGLCININDSVYLKPYAGFLHRTIKMSARDGYLQYPPGSPRIPVYGVGIIYEQIYYIPYIALSSEISVSDKIKFLAGISVSLFGFAEDVDNHVHRNPGDDIDFYSEYDEIIYLNANIGCRYMVNEAIAITLNLLYEYVPEQKGDTYYINASTGIKSQVFKNAAGLRYSVYSIQIALSYNLNL